ncbi:hypothetical protein ASE73_02345 [Sphingomonas sp. Leaf24]|uniref:hypothetical protein n=1 Tax=unclassified Sphingomonas TaxID=196159 RepID=UPI0006F5C438|nr:MULTISPECIES: hypothetical protein [unclassified Sphingomonas]KQM23082.1 hypothetical protein ASE50_02345 [Sphingomonas sp. Leaf5]KQM95940.1 hypothetical protein ASE73_02345 [Sphingomonas sp. Leaf24]
MSSADDPIAQLRALPPADRRAVLARLTPAERRRVEAAPTTPPFAADIAARLADPGEAMTPAGRAALVKAGEAFAAPVVAGPGPSLLGRLRGAMGGR